MFLESVAEGERGVVNGVQASLNQMMYMVKFALVTGLPYTHQFGLLVILSYLSVSTGAVLQAVFVCTLAPSVFLSARGRNYEKI